MTTAIREYDAKLDSKKRITLRSNSFDYYHVSEMNNGIIILEPRELTVPFQVSANTLSMMDESVKNLKAGKVSAPIDLSGFEDEGTHHLGSSVDSCGKSGGSSPDNDHVVCHLSAQQDNCIKQ